MTRLWTYPWSVVGDGPAASMAALAGRGVDGVALAGHYHSVQTIEPRASDGPRVQSFPGGCYFEPDPTDFEGRAIDPPVVDVPGVEDPFGAATTAATDAGLGVRAWTVCLHNSRLGDANPDYRVESVFGDAHDHAPCPSHPEVRAYYAAVVRSLSAYDVDAVDLESVGFPGALHGHGADFGHSKNHAVTTPAGELLFSQCFCDACRAAAADHLDVSAARERVRELVRRAAAGPGERLPELSALVREDPLFDRLFAFRASVVEDLLAALADASGSVPLNYYVADGFGATPGGGWPAGVVLNRVGEHLDRVTALAYTADPDAARARVRALQSLFDGPVDVGVTLDPAVVDARETFEAVVTAARSVADGELYVYNHAVMTDEHADWLEAVI